MRLEYRDTSSSDVEHTRRRGSRQRRITNTEFLSYCNYYTLLINSYICIFGTTKFHYLSITQPSPHRLGRGSSFAPVEGKIYDTLSTGNRPVYNTASRPGRSLPLGKTQYPLYRRLGGPQGWSGQVRKISPPPGFDPRTVQPIASRYTDYATWPTFLKLVEVKYHTCSWHG